MPYITPEILSCPGVYPPSEDSELLLKTMEILPKESVLDMGTGTGVLGVHAALRGGIVTAVDVSEKALVCTEKNARLNCVQMTTIKSDLFEKISERFDVVLFNPPYLPNESWSKEDIEDKQWDGGRDGSETLRTFIRELPRHLRGRCYLLFSSLTGGGKEVMESLLKKDFISRQLDKKRLFFEILYVYELIPRYGGIPKPEIL